MFAILVALTAMQGLFGQSVTSSNLTIIRSNLADVCPTGYTFGTSPDNSDPTVFYRADNSCDYSKLRLSIADDTTGSFDIGHTQWQTGNWVSTLSVEANGDAYLRRDLHLTGKLLIGSQGWSIEAPDYVFKKDYNLISLDSTAKFIDKEGHLPGVPSAKEMEQGGVDVVQMNFTLLKKIEELTLHTIRIEQELASLKASKAGAK